MSVSASASDLKMGKGQSKVYVAKESFKPPTDDGTTCGYISFEARLHVFRLLFNKVIQQ